MNEFTRKEIVHEVPSLEIYQEIWAYLHRNQFVHQTPHKDDWFPNYHVLDTLCENQECGHFWIDRAKGCAKFIVYQGTRLDTIMNDFPTALGAPPPSPTQS
jgi:hypothetical protein